MNNHHLRFFDRKKAKSNIILSTALLSIGFYLADVFIDVTFFDQGENFFSALTEFEGYEMYFRSFVIFLFIIMALLTWKMLDARIEEGNLLSEQTLRLKHSQSLAQLGGSFSIPSFLRKNSS